MFSFPGQQASILQPRIPEEQVADEREFIERASHRQAYQMERFREQRNQQNTPLPNRDS